MASYLLGRTFLNYYVCENNCVQRCMRIFSSLNNLVDMNKYPNKYQVTRSYALKSALPIKWIRPEKVPCYKQQKSGDLETLKKLDTKNLTPLEFRDCDELKNAPEEVKRLFTLEYFPYKKTVEYLRHHFVDRVKQHKLDYNSPEARVARMTVDIRDLQQYNEKYPTNRRAKVRLKETIDKRKKLLKFLRTWDYKKFEWLIEELNLVYKPQPLRESYLRVERKRSLKMLTKSYCDDIVNSRLKNYQKTLENKQESFLEEKIKKLEWIIQEEKECGAEPTVTENDVERAKLQLQNWKQKYV